MQHQIPVDESARAFDPAADRARGDGTHEVAPDIAYKRLILVNVAYVGLPAAGDGGWVLIDAGIPGMADQIRGASRERFGGEGRPAAIVMTHAHFDHAGSLIDLARDWNVPIYAHSLEVPYLDGSAAYPPADPSVGGGLLAATSGMFPRDPIDVRQWLQTLPQDGTIPVLPEWRWIHTPGHTPGHISLWRQADRALIAGNVFITTTQESAYAVMTQRTELHGPPMYFTQNWDDARASVRRVAALQPEIAVTGHGQAMRGREMLNALHILARDFDKIAVPDEYGKYIRHPTNAEDGTAYDIPVNAA